MLISQDVKPHSSVIGRKFGNKETKCLEIILTFKLLLEKESCWLTPFPTQGSLSKIAQLAGYVEVSSKYVLFLLILMKLLILVYC